MQAMTAEKRVKKCLERHPDWPDLRVAKNTRTKKADVAAVRLGQTMPEPMIGGDGRAGFISLEKVIQKYDIRAAIIKELARLQSGKLIAETELCSRTAGTDRNRFRRTVENNADELRKHRVKLKVDESSEGRWYWGSEADIAEALRIRDL